MALVNSAIELSTRGKKVLVADFDLEVAGLNTIPLLRNKANTAGIVDFVTNYLETNRAPDVRDFTYSLPEFPNLTVMPSGKPNGDNSLHSQSIDWESLYNDRDGYLLFEDMKAQWNEYLNPDYVLIDSSAGYAATGSICTRQLPDSVTIMFFPDDQNLKGLTRVVKDIRNESRAPRNKTIGLKFVMSNVPALVDEQDDVLSRIMKRFRSDLKLKEDPHIIHRSESLSLLRQAVFVKERPNSRLAREYGVLVDQIETGNLADRDGALKHIQAILNGQPELFSRRQENGLNERDDEATIREIKRKHVEDGQVMAKLAELRFKQGKLIDAEELLDTSIDELANDDIDAISMRAKVRSDLGDDVAASKDALRVLNRRDVYRPTIMKMCRYIRGVDGETVASLPSITELQPSWRLELANVFSRRNQVAFAQAVLRNILEDPDCSEKVRLSARPALAISYIRNQAFDKAAELLSTGHQKSVNELTIQDAFNYGVALWGKASEVNPGPFKYVVKLNEQVPPKEPSSNYHQCLALANWTVGDISKAKTHLSKARDRIESRAYEFSSWRYERVSRKQFKEDLDALEKMIYGDEATKPRFLEPEHPKRDRSG